jgi:hypothetical protein
MSSSRTGTTPTRADAELLIDPISEFFAVRERIAAILENPLQIRLAARFLSRCLVSNPLIANQPRAQRVQRREAYLPVLILTRQSSGLPPEIPEKTGVVASICEWEHEAEG